MATLDAAVRFLAIAVLASTLSCQRASTTGIAHLKAKPPACSIFGCGKPLKRGVLVVLPANFDPQHPAADLEGYDPGPDGDGTPDGPHRNDGTPPTGKKSPLDIDLKDIVRGAGAGDFAFVSIFMTNQDYYFDTNAVETEDAKGNKFLRAVKVFRSGKLLVFRVKMADPKSAVWIDYDLYVMKKVPGGTPLRILVDPKVKNGG